MRTKRKALAGVTRQAVLARAAFELLATRPHPRRNADAWLRRRRLAIVLTGRGAAARARRLLGAADAHARQTDLVVTADVSWAYASAVATAVGLDRVTALLPKG
jgi:hypothetical protein